MDITSLLSDPQQLQAMLAAVFPKLLLAGIVLVTFWFVLRWTRPMLRKALSRAGFHEALNHMLVEGIFKSSLVVVALIAAAAQLGINVAAALAGLGVVGIAVGFAAQETVANMIAGFLVFWDRPFKIGDYITTQSQYGKVQEITMRTTRIRTMENTFVVIPNKQIIGDLLINHSMYGEIRINVPLGIAYKEQIAAARDVLIPVLNEIPGVLDTPAAVLVATGLGDSSVNLSARVWISDAAIEMDTHVRVVEACKVALDKAGIEIPFPHLQLFIEDVRGPAQRALAGIPKLVN